MTVIVKAFHLGAQEGKTFADTENHWAKSAIATAAAASIVAGYSTTVSGRMISLPASKWRRSSFAPPS
ncbi:S-layer homology domain-containing protein [Paenibacillus frigoriresistens]|nr:S-layer homology domain-containing protein [Paenibacillus frigoriresistens]